MPKLIKYYICCSFSYFLYTISHPSKSGLPQVDLSSDVEASVNQSCAKSLSPCQLAVERVIVKLFTHHKCNVIITDRLRSLFTMKLWRMGKSICSLGGKARSQVYAKWEKSKWTIQLHENEVIQYLGSKRKRSHIENAVLLSSKKKLTKVEDDLKAANDKLKEITNQYESLKTSCNTLSKALANSDKDMTLSQSRTKKEWKLCTPQYQRKRKKEVAQNVKTALLFTEHEDFKTTQVELTNKSTQEKVVCVQHDGELKLATKEMLEEQGSSEMVVNQTLYIKERFNMSNQAYHEMAMVNKELPRSCAIIKAAKQLDEKSIIYPTPGRLKGVQQSLKERLVKRIEHLAKRDEKYNKSQCVKVKITGDGKAISRSMHLVVIAFTLVEDEPNPNAPRGNHTIALLNTTEVYDNLVEALDDIATEINNLKSLTVNNVLYDLEFFFAADMKFEAIIMGIESASSTYSCIWCKCPATERHDITKTWSATNSDEGARTIKEIQELSMIKKHKRNKKYGCVRQPIFPSIPIDHVIPDVLHLFLRISDILINLLILELRRLDGIEKATITSESLKKTLAMNSNVSRYVQFLNESKINFHMYVDKDSKSLKWRDLTGPEKLKLFNKIDIAAVFPGVPNATLIHKIWKDFLTIYNTLCLNPINRNQIKDFQVSVQKWLSLFLSVYQSRHVTPYMHTLIFHVPEFLNLYGSLLPFSQQGPEKLNDNLTKDYYRNTNHQEQDALRQLLLKLNRLEELTDISSERKKQVQHCKICKQEGHNSRTCKNKNL